MTVWKNGVLLLLVMLLLLVVLLLLVIPHLHGHLLLDLLDQHSCCCSKYEMTVWQDGKLSAKLRGVIFSTKTVSGGQNKCASGDKSGGRMGQM